MDLLWRLEAQVWGNYKGLAAWMGASGYLPWALVLCPEAREASGPRPLPRARIGAWPPSLRYIGTHAYYIIGLHGFPRPVHGLKHYLCVGMSLRLPYTTI